MADGDSIQKFLWETGDPCKKCSRCRKVLPFDQFRRKKRGDRCSWCRECERTENLAYSRSPAGKANHTKQKLSQYGLTPEDFAILFEKQKGLCAICGQPEQRESPRGGWARLVVDHDHRTGKVRELLCHRCNRAIGLYRDDLALLRKAVAYLEKHAGE